MEGSPTMNCEPHISPRFYILCSILIALPLLGAEDADKALYPKSVGEMKGILAVFTAQQNSSSSIGEKYLERLKAYRYVCDVPYDNMSLSKDMEECAYQACVAMSLNNEMSHSPKKPDAMSDEDYQKARRGAGSGNLFAGLTNPVGCVDGWMNDSGPGNIQVVGHRRWCLNPGMLKTAFATKGHFAVMYAHDGSRSPVPDWDYVAFPTRGYMPTSMFGGGYAWSVSLNMGKYAAPSQEAVNVAVQPLDKELGEPLKLNCLYVDNAGYGSGSAIMFRPDGFTVKPDAKFMVAITGLQNKSHQAVQIQYLVHFIDIAKAPDTPESQLTITTFMRKRLDAINALTDHVEKWAGLTDFLADKLLSAAGPALSKEAKDGIAELSKDPAVRREQEAARQYDLVADLEKHMGKGKLKKTTVVTSYRDLANVFADTRAGKRAVADFERLNTKDLGIAPPANAQPTAAKDTAAATQATKDKAPAGTAPANKDTAPTATTPSAKDKPPVAATPATKETAPQAAHTPAKVTVSPAALEQWQARLVKKLDAAAKSGANLRLYTAGQNGREIRAADDKTLTLRIQGNDLPMPWKQVALGDRAALARELVKDDDVEALLIGAVFQLADGDAVAAEDLFGKAAVKDADAVKSAKAGLAPRQ